MSSGTTIELAAVSHAYGVGAARREVLRDVTLDLTERRIGVVGANGSGKSTFARLLNGLVVRLLQLEACVAGQYQPVNQGWAEGMQG